MTAAPAECRRCSECDGEQHHWLPYLPEFELANGEACEPYIPCKHCDAKAGYCDECEGPIFPVTGANVCATCTADRGDFEP